MSASELFSGDERLLNLPIGKPIRAAAPAALATSDRRLLIERLAAGSPDVGPLIEVVFGNHLGMIAMYLEWAWQLPTSFAAHVAEGREREVTRAALALWNADVASLESSAAGRAGVEAIRGALALEQIVPGAVDGLRAAVAGNQPSALHGVLGGVLEAQGAVRAAAAQGAISAADATALVDACFTAAAVRHDALTQWVSAYASTVLGQLGQDAAEKTIQKSFSECSFHAGMFMLPKLLSPEQLAAFLAEHLRAHFSGRDRGGSVEVIEEADRFRLVFDPCGSGGAMRQRLGAAGRRLDVLPDASPMTWSRAGEVPAYCTHCAFNEIHSIDTLGYPALITEFEADPARKCGWTVYKDPAAIPERYFARVGRAKPR